MTGKVVTIVGGGWSAALLDLRRLAGVVIAVNDSAVHLPRWHYAVSMDRLWAENRIDAIVERQARQFAGEVWLRRSAVQNLARYVEQFGWIRVFECDHQSSKFSDLNNTLHGPNSGACALNLAWKLQPSRVYLVGFDMNRNLNGDAYWYPPYPWSTSAGGTSSRKYGTWAGQFEDARRAFELIGCDVATVNTGSAIATFRRITPRTYLEETK